jgi:hypothetical protein
LVARHTDSCGLADVDGQLGFLPEHWLVCTAHYATGQYILAHVDIACRVERHGGCGCRGMLGVWYWASLMIGSKKGTLLTAEMRGRASGDQGECLIKSSNIQKLELYRRRLATSNAERRRDNARPTPQRQRTRLLKGLSQGNHIPASRPRQLSFLQDHSTASTRHSAASPLAAGTTAYDADHLQLA